MFRFLLGDGSRRGLAAVAAMLWSLVTAGACCAAEPDAVRVGVLTKGNLSNTLAAWPATIENYLGEKIPDYTFEMVPLGFDDIGAAVANASVDFVLTNPASYVELEFRYGISRIATLKKLWRDNIFSTAFGAVIIARRDNASIRNLKDLIGAHFMAVDEKAFGGWTMALRELKAAGIDPHEDFTALNFAGSHEAVVDAVLNGEVDAGTIRTGILEEMAKEGLVDLTQIRVIETPGLYDMRVHHRDFPFLRSTRLYPEWPFAKLKHTSERLAERVTIALLDMPADHVAAIAAGSAGWTVPLNYQPVHELLEELGSSPYQRSDQEALATIWQRYRPWLVLAAGLTGFLTMVTVVTIRLNRKIGSAKAALEKEALVRRRTEETLRQSKERFRSLVENTNDFVWETNGRGEFTYASPQVSRMLGKDAEELVGARAYELLGCEAIATGVIAVSSPVARLFTGCESAVKRKDGSTVVVETSGTPFFAADGAFMGYRGISRDITDRKFTADALHQEQERAQITLESIADGVIRTDVRGIVEYMNAAASKITGWENSKALGQHVLDVLSLVDEASGKSVTAPLGHALHEGRSSHLSGTTLLSKGEAGRESHIEVRIAPVRNPQGRIVGSVIVFHDVTEVRRLTREMAYQATHDALTELINRSEFERRLERALGDAQGFGQSSVLAYLDLDQFKVVNDTSGHVAGDALLRQLAHRVALTVRDCDVLARLGGDEFGVLLTDCSANEATPLINELCRLVKEFRFNWEGKVFQVGVSAGLVEINGLSGTLTDVLSAADSACYVAKEQGRNRIHWFQPDDAAVAQRHGQMQWVHRIKRALEENRFNLYLEAFKALSRAASKRQHFEILLRLVNERGEEITPMAFIPAAERYHLMPAVDRWVIASTFSALREVSTETSRDTVYAINLSGQSLTDDEFLNFTIQQLDASGLAPDQICFEITETAAIANINRAVRFMSVLKGMGCRFALDDFGSGLSSFAYLKNLPVDYLKIDRGFVQNLKRDAIDRAMVEAINQVGQLMGLQTIAEGVADGETLEIISTMGIDYAQGHSIGELSPLLTVAGPAPITKRVSAL